MASVGVQFRGVPDIMNMFQNMNLSNWAIKYGKNIVMKYQGAFFEESNQVLSQFLHTLEMGDGNSIYTLCMYEDLPKGHKIKPSLEPDFAFNFMLFDQDRYPSQRQAQRRLENEAMEKKIADLETKLALLIEDDEDDEKPAGIAGFLNGMLENDRFKTYLQDKIFGIVDTIFKKPADVIPMPSSDTVQRPGQVGAVTETSPILIDQEQHEKLQSAINVLVCIDPKLGDNLIQIAKMAEKSPDKYFSAIKMLNTFL